MSDIPENTIDIDIAIGEPGYIGRGVASQSLRLLVQRLYLSEPVPMIMIYTSVNNNNAIRAYERAGFERDRIFHDPEFGEMWLFFIKPVSDNSFSPTGFSAGAAKSAG